MAQRAAQQTTSAKKLVVQQGIGAGCRVVAKALDDATLHSVSPAVAKHHAVSGRCRRWLRCRGRSVFALRVARRRSGIAKSSMRG